MRHLLWIFALFVSLACHLVPAAAAQRVLLTAEGQASAGAASLRSSATAMDLRASALRSGTVRVIVGLRVPFAPSRSLPAAEARQQAAEIAAAATVMNRRFAAAIARAPGRAPSFDSVPFLALEVTPAELEQLAADPEVLSITPDLVLTTSLAESAALVRAPEAWAAGYTGRGQTVAVIDSGVERSHLFLNGKVVSEACYTNSACPGGSSSSTASGSGRPCSSANCDHGTHVAGIVAGRASGLSGIAPGASIIAIQVFTPQSASTAMTYMSDVIKGMERVLALRNDFDIAAVNLSLGTLTTFASSCDSILPAMAAIINELKAAGIATVVASGNGGVSNGMSLPACMSGAVSVGSVSDRNWGTCSFSGITPAPTAADMVACYSNASEMLSLLAPGSAINSSVPNGGYGTKHGTSMAAPHVAAAFAVLAEKAPGASVADLLTALRTTGKPITDHRNSRITTPRIDVKAALDTLSSGVNTRTLALNFAGNGRGTVTFTPAGSLASCTANCANRYAPDTVVVLTASSTSTSYFGGWSGACSGTSSCTVTMSAAREVWATFQAISSGPPQALTLTTAGSGAGAITVSADGLTRSCTGTCTLNFGRDTMVTLTAAPGPGVALASWSGACRGRKASCVVRMSGPRSVTAAYSTLPVYAVNYTKAGTADGTIDVEAAGSTMSCAANCAPSLPAGTAIRVTARPAAGKSFGGWSGVCRGMKASCSFTLRSSARLSAVFR